MFLKFQNLNKNKPVLEKYEWTKIRKLKYYSKPRTSKEVLNVIVLVI